MTTYTSNTHFTYNFVKKTIVGSQNAISKANKGITPYYQELVNMLAEHPDFSVEIKLVSRNDKKRTYSNLTLARMKEFIETMDNKDDLLNEFEHVCILGKAKGSQYPTVKKWFLSKFKDVYIDPVKEENRTLNEVENQKEVA